MPDFLNVKGVLPAIICVRKYLTIHSDDFVKSRSRTSISHRFAHFTYGDIFGYVLFRNFKDFDRCVKCGKIDFTEKYIIQLKARLLRRRRLLLKKTKPCKRCELDFWYGFRLNNRFIEALSDINAALNLTTKKKLNFKADIIIDMIRRAFPDVIICRLCGSFNHLDPKPPPFPVYPGMVYPFKEVLCEECKVVEEKDTISATEGYIA